MTPGQVRAFDELVERVVVRASATPPTIIGIAGAPGAGKTTLATALTAALRERLGVHAVAHAPMDGFHLADVELRRLGLLHRKGAPDTFDAGGYAALLRRIRALHTDTVYAPAFERDLEQPIAGAIPIAAGVRVVITEGNYLLLDEPRWREAAAELDEIWYVTVEDSVRTRRLVDRHIEFGKPPDYARRWVEDSDELNARLVTATADRADLMVSTEIVPGPTGRRS